MKKIILVLFFAALLCTSCSKYCSCKATINGETIEEEHVVLEEGERCSDYNKSVTVLNQTAELRCAMQLFE